MLTHRSGCFLRLSVWQTVCTLARMNKTPHFLRVTQTLALVSGLTLPALVESCGGEVESSTDAGYDGHLLGLTDARSGVAPVDSGFDGRTTGVADSGVSQIDSGYDGSTIGDQTIDAGSSD